MCEKILEIDDVMLFTKMSRSLVYKAMADGDFPRNFRLGRSRCVGWLESDVLSWITTQAGKNRQELDVAGA